MPKVSNKINWETTEVSFYKFVCKDPNILYSYVGHTTNYSSRKNSHKSDCNNSISTRYNFPLYVFMREQGGWNNWSMVQIHSQICTNSLEARQIEQELLEKQQFKLNAYKAYQSEEQHKIYEEEYKKKYYEKNKERISIQKAEYRQKNKEHFDIKGAEYREKNKEQIRIQKAEYYQKNKEQKIKQQSKYAEEHKEKIANYLREYRKKKKAEKEAQSINQV